MHSKFLKIIKAAIISIIVAFCFVFFISFIAVSIGKEKFELATNLLEMITVDKSIELQEIEPVLKDNVLINYPTYGSKYGTLKIESINVNLPIYYGETYAILKSGIAHDSTSYFPGEGGSIIYAGHNFKTFLASLPNVKIGDKIEIETSYGKFQYEVYDKQIIDETDIEKVPVQKEKEILMLYTCYPINNIGHAYQRYVVYANLVNN